MCYAESTRPPRFALQPERRPQTVLACVMQKASALCALCTAAGMTTTDNFVCVMQEVRTLPPRFVLQPE